MKDLSEFIPPLAKDMLEPGTLGRMWIESAIEKAYLQGQIDMREKILKELGA